MLSNFYLLNMSPYVTMLILRLCIVVMRFLQMFCYTYLYMQFKIKSVSLVALFMFAGISNAHAALLYFDPSFAEISRGDSITADLRIDTDEGECINTIDATIHYDSSINVVDISRGESILNIWVENPVIDKENHTVHFAGGIPGGYCGRIPGDPSLTNVILKLALQSPGFTIGGGDNLKNPRIWLDDISQVLLHDGYGTPATVRLQDATIHLLDTVGSEIQDEWRSNVQEDTEPPSDFSITLTKDDFAFNKKYFIVFNSNDKQSGIDHYEVMEEPFSEFYAFKWGRADAPWIRTESPYILKDQTLNSTIRVKAIDKAGNSIISTLVPDTALRSMSQNLLMMWTLIGGIVLLVLIFAYFAFWMIRKRRRENVVVLEGEIE